jgi:hypothetical protein
MNLAYLKTFVTVAELRHFARAAATCNLSQLIEVNVQGALPTQDIFVIDHPQKHHGAACSAMLRLLAAAFPESSEDRRRQKG